MANGECLADPLKPCQAVGMMRVAHGERERVVREDLFEGYGSVWTTRSRKSAAAALVWSV